MRERLKTFYYSMDASDLAVMTVWVMLPGILLGGWLATL